MKNLPDSVLKELAGLAGTSEDDIDFTDIPATAAQDWVGGVRGRFYRPTKQLLSLRIDKDILEWIKGDQPKGYHSRINGILRSAMIRSLSGASSNSSAGNADTGQKAQTALVDRIALPGKQVSISTGTSSRANQQSFTTTPGEHVRGKKRRSRGSQGQGENRVTLEIPANSREEVT